MVFRDVLLFVFWGGDIIGELDVGEDDVFVGVLDIIIKCGWFWVVVDGWKWICFFWFIVVVVKCCIM